MEGKRVGRQSFSDRSFRVGGQAWGFPRPPAGAYSELEEPVVDENQDFDFARCVMSEPSAR